jgi:hypothetical protein
MGREVPEGKVDRSFRHGIQVHFKEVYGKLTVVVTEFETLGM